jgi:hypothetical protein
MCHVFADVTAFEAKLNALGLYIDEANLRHLIFFNLLGCILPRQVMRRR